MPHTKNTRFSVAEGTFLIAVGGDGCPFGKNESAWSFLLSFMNVGKLVASSNDNFIIFGGNCEETSLVVRKYCQFLCRDLKGTFAPERTSLWHPWKYEDRIKIANEVEKFKKTFSEKQLKEKQFRRQID